MTACADGGDQVPDLGTDYRVTVVPSSAGPRHVDVIVDHRPTWRRKSGTAPSWLRGQMARCLREDIESDLSDVAEGNLPARFGRFAPEGERGEAAAFPLARR